MKTFHPAPGPNACGACQHWFALPAQVGAPPHGECRRRAPVIVQDTPPSRLGTWPVVFPLEVCGEFDRRLIPDEA